jgi:hypothetical protein
MEVHELAKLFPEMSDFDFEELKEDIKENGLLNPITIYEGMILDGAHRARACEELGRTPEAEEFEGTAADALTFVVSSNVHRRHLTESQKAVISLDLLEKAEAEARKRQAAQDYGRGVEQLGGDDPQVRGPRSREQVARQMGMKDPSGRLISGAKQVMKAEEVGELPKGTVDRIREGHESVHGARADLHKARAAKRTAERVAKADKEAFEGNPHKVKEFTEVMQAYKNALLQAKKDADGGAYDPASKGFFEKKFAEIANLQNELEELIG